MTTLNILSEDSLMQDIHERNEVRQLKVKIEAGVKLAGQSPFFKIKYFLVEFSKFINRGLSIN